MSGPAAFATYPSLAGRSVLVTGGASGIGADLVTQFCGQGAHVAFIDIDDGAGARLAASLGQSSGRSPLFRRADLLDLNESLMAVADMEAIVGSFSVLVNNAGDDARHAALEITPDLWDRQMGVNLRHQFFLAQHMVRQLPPDRRGSIINLGSIAWMKGARDVLVYATAKSATVGLTKSMSREFGDRGVRVNAIAPGWIGTEKQIERAERLRPGSFGDAVAAQAIPEVLTPGDVSRLALWLAADDSIHVTGQTIVVDGGMA